MRADDDFASPRGDNVGPNQLLLLDRKFFRDGWIEATVNPIGIQPGSHKGHLECGLIGRYRSPDSYIFGGLGCHGREYSISRWRAGGFIEIKSEGGGAGSNDAWTPRRLKLEFKGAHVRLSVDEKTVISAETDPFEAGRCGMRVDWTEADYHRVVAESGDQGSLVIAPIGAHGSFARTRSDYVLDRIIAPALAQCGYKAERADNIEGLSMISDEVMRRLAEDPLVVADLTSYNPNVFYELAIRHANHKPVVQIIERGSTLPFDIKDMRTIEVSLGLDRDVEEARNQLRSYVVAIQKSGGQFFTPVP
jgi:hypothetical protein